MMELTQRDLNFIIRNLPSDIRKLLKSTPGLILGGGFIRGVIANETISDIDLFGPSKEMVHDAAKKLAFDRSGKIHTTDNAYTVLAPPRRPVQFVHRWTFDDPVKCIQSFDFTVCQAGIWWEGGELFTGWHSACHDAFYSDLAAKRLVYTYPVVMPLVP
jgi:hypothetical protein